MPDRDEEGAAAALTVAGPTKRFSEDKIAHFLDALKVAATAIEQSSFMMFTR